MVAMLKSPALAQTKEIRKHFRVVPPAALVKEFALWFCPPFAERMITLEQLGMAHMCNINDTGDIRLENISAGGLCYSLSQKTLGSTERLRHKHCYVFLKLRRPQPGKLSQYFLFFSMVMRQAKVVGDRVHLRGNVAMRGMPSHVAKTMQLFNVEQVGIRDLAVWCEEIARMGRGLMPAASTGLDLEYLLLELSILQGQKSAAEVHSLRNPEIISDGAC